MDDLSEKPCRCGDTMGEVIGFNHIEFSDGYRTRCSGLAGTAQNVRTLTRQFFGKEYIDTN